MVKTPAQPEPPFSLLPNGKAALYSIFRPGQVRTDAALPGQENEASAVLPCRAPPNNVASMQL
jgi:hypothetical protein